MNRRSFLTGFGTAGVATLAGCGENSTPTQTATSNQTETATETTISPTSTVESLPDEEIEQLLEALEVRLYLDGYSVLSILRNDGFIGVEYAISTESRERQLHDWIGISQSFYNEVMEEGFTPETLQILYAEGGNININTDWIDAYQSGSLSSGSFLVNIDQGTLDELGQRSYYRQAFELELIRSGFDIESITLSGSEIQLEYGGSDFRGGFYNNVLTISRILTSELLVSPVEVTKISGAPAEGGDYVIQYDWIRQWIQNEITDARYLSYIEETRA